MDEILTVREVADHLKLTERTVYAMVTERELPGFKVRGQWRVRRADFERWLHAIAGGGASASEGVAETPPDHDHDDEGGSDEAEGDEAVAAVSHAVPIEALTARVPQAELHKRFVEALGASVQSHSPLSAKPLEVDLLPPLPGRIRVYLFNATRPPGGRPLGEHKVQLIMPGQRRGKRGSFDHGDGRIVLLAGYSAEENVFVLWDAVLYPHFAWSRNVQVKAETIIEASAGKLAQQHRHLRPADGLPSTEILIAAPAKRLKEALTLRMQVTRDHMTRD